MMRSNTVKNCCEDFKKGHRQRLYSKLNENGYDTLQDYEVVEMLLFLIFKRKDTKPIAKRLIERFESVDRILSASKEELMEIDGIGEGTYNSIKIVDMVLKACVKKKIEKKDVINCFNDVIEYCKIHMKNIKNEELRVIFIDSSNHIIGDKVMQKGTVDSVHIYPREILKKCLDYGAKGIILIHNHPSGDVTPSESDILSTKRLIESCNVFDVKLIDHIITGGDHYSSFRALKII